MFEVKEVYETGSNASDQMLIDETRNVCIQRVERFNLRGILRMKMIIDEMVIIFDVREMLSKSDGKIKIICSFASFSSKDDSDTYGLQYTKIGDQKELERLELIAIEGMICFGSLYNGDKYDDGDIVFVHNKKNYTRGCFS